MKIKLFIILITSLISVYSQKNDKVVARIGNDVITETEFITRYELMPQVNAHRKPDSLGKELLYSLIAEKLWAKEAENLGYDKTDYFVKTFEPLQKMFLKDALFKEEVESKIKISPEEIAKGIIRSKFKNITYILPYKDSSEAANTYQLLLKGTPVDTVLRAAKIDSSSAYEVTYGKMDDNNLEDMIYKLKPGEYTIPVKYRGNWFIFYLKNKILSTGKDDNVINKDVKNNFHDRKAREIGLNYLSQFMAGVKSQVSDTLFNDLLTYIMTDFESKQPDSYEKKQKTLYLSEASVNKIMGAMGSTKLNSTFFSFKGKDVSMERFLFNLKNQPLGVKNKDNNYVAYTLKKRIDSYIEEDLLAEESLKRGLDRKPEFQKEISQWKENYVSHMLRNEYLTKDSVSDAEVYQYYLSLTNKIDTIPSVNMLEILTDKLEIVELVLNELNKGTDFRELAKQYSKRKWAKEKGGELGLLPISVNKELASIAVNLKVGEVYGPIKTADGYSIIKLIDKQDSIRSYRESYDNVKNELKTDLIAGKLKSYFEDETLKLSNKYGVQINWDIYSKIKLSPIPMFTYRYMGFGGRIAAVPYTLPWYSWSKKLTQKIL